MPARVIKSIKIRGTAKKLAELANKVSRLFEMYFARVVIKMLQHNERLINNSFRGKKFSPLISDQTNMYLNHQLTNVERRDTFYPSRFPSLI